MLTKDRSRAEKLFACLSKLLSSEDDRHIHESKVLPGLRAGLESATEGVAQFLAREKFLILVLLSAAYALETGFRAWRKLFWFDELFTIDISRLPTLGSVWKALSHIDLNPPLVYVLARFSEKTFGPGHLAARLPEVLAFWIFCLCLFRFVRLRTNVLGGFIAFLFPVITSAYWYSYEARPHGLVLGFCGIALISWQSAASKTKQPKFWSLLGLGLSLASALLTHSYAFLLFLPLAIGELTRLLLYKRIDYPVWLTILVAGSPIFFSLRLLHTVQSVRLSAPFFPANLAMLGDSYVSLFSPCVRILILALIFLCLRTITQRPTSDATRSSQDSEFRPYEIAVLVGFLMIPFFSYFAAKVTGAPLIQRYSISTVIGVACLFATAFAKKPSLGVPILLLMGLEMQIQFAHFLGARSVEEPSTSTVLSASLASFKQRYEWMALDPHKDLAIVLLDKLDFAPTFFYAPTDLSKRLAYSPLLPSDEFNWESYRGLKQYCVAPGHLISRQELLGMRTAFLSYGTPRSIPELQNLIDNGANIAVEKASLDHYLVLVTFPHPL